MKKYLDAIQGWFALRILYKKGFIKEKYRLIDVLIRVYKEDKKDESENV